MLSAVIVEDESKFLTAFKSILTKNCPEIHLTGSCGSVKEAAKFIQEVKPDIVFLDIQLSDGNGFDLLKILESEMSKPDFNNLRVIFTTAYNQYAIQAFRLSAVDYLLKPIVSDELVEAVKKVIALQNAWKGQEQYHTLIGNLSQNNKDKKICLSTLSEVRLCKISEIIRCESEHNYTRFYFTNAKPLMVSKTLKEYEDMLKDFGFERVHQTHLVNIAYVKSYIKKENGFVLMSDGSEVPISRRKKEHLLSIIKNI
jgi:two-component system LytT family response regulator